jgi:hypothetical protein
MRTFLVAALLCPLAAFAQAGGAPPAQGKPVAPKQQQPPPQQQERGPGAGPGSRMGPGQGGMRGRDGRGDPARMERRMRLARTLGLAEALDLEPADALRLGDLLAKTDEKRFALHQQLRDSNQTLRRAAAGERATPAEVDQAIQRVLTARGQLEQLDREAIQTLVKDLTPEKRARAVLFMEQFERRFGPGPRVMKHRNQRMGPDGGMRGMGPPEGGMGAMAGTCPECPMDDGDRDDEE